MSEYGTAYSLGQYNEVLKAVISAFPKALEGTDPKATIEILQKKGEEFGLALNRALLAVSKEQEPVRFSIVGGLTFEVISPFMGDEERIRIEYMPQRAKYLEVSLEEKYADYLRDHEEEIPKALERYHFMFTGTVRDHSGLCNFFCLNCENGHWCLRFYFFPVNGCSGNYIGPNARLLRLCE